MPGQAAPPFIEEPPVSLKIAYISDERYPSVHTDTQQVMKTIDALGALGARVDFIQPRMAKHLLKPPAQRKADICRYYNITGNFELRDILFWPASDLRAEKFFHGILSPLKTFFGNYDAVYTRNILPLVTASRLHQPVLFETYRPLCRTNPSAFRALRRAAQHRGFLGVSTHSEYAREAMIEAGLPRDIIRAIPNGYDPADFQHLPPQADARRELDLPAGQHIAVYTGHIRPDKGIHALLDLAAELPEVLMLIVGGSPSDVERVRSDVRARNLDNIRLEGHVPMQRVAHYLSAADVLVLPPTAKPLMGLGHTVLPIKTFTYLAAGKPILAPDLPDTKGVLAHDQNCWMVPPDVPAVAAQGLTHLLHNPALAQRLAQQARDDAQHFSWEGRATRLLQFIEERIQAVRDAR
jgi:glycosyltransferase involved in cell wall biosynthesis